MAVAVPPTGAASTAAAGQLPLLPLPHSFAAVLTGNVTQPPSPRTVSKSFSDVFSGKGVIPVKQVSKFKGKPAVFFTKEDIEQLAAPFKFALVGKFGFNSRPLMAKIRKFFVSLGLKSLISIGLLHDSFILINVGTEEDYTRLMLRAVWFVEGKAMKLFKWTPNFNPLEDSSVVPVWIGLPGLPIHFFNRAALFSIAKAVGNPLKSDEPTAMLTRPSVARVCVELDVSKDWPNRVWIGDEKVGFWQEVCVENPPQFCGYCKTLGHGESECFKLHPSLFKDQRRKTEKEDGEERAVEVGMGVFKKKEEQGIKKKKEETINPPKILAIIKNRSVLGLSSESENHHAAGISLTPYPGSEKIKKKQEKNLSEKDKGKGKLVAEFPTSTGPPLTEKSFPSTSEVKAGMAVLEENYPVAVVVQAELPSDHLPPLLRNHLSISGLSHTNISDLDIFRKRTGTNCGKEVQPLDQELNEFQVISSSSSIQPLHQVGFKIQPSDNKGIPVIQNDGKCNKSGSSSQPLEMKETNGVVSVKSLGQSASDNGVGLVADEEIRIGHGSCLVGVADASAVASGNETAKMTELCQAAAKVADNRQCLPDFQKLGPQPLDPAVRNPIEIQPLDPSILNSKSHQPQSILDQNEYVPFSPSIPLVVGQSEGGPSGLLKRFGSGALGFEFFSGPNLDTISRPHDLNANTASLLPIRLQTSKTNRTTGQDFNIVGGSPPDLENNEIQIRSRELILQDQVEYAVEKNSATPILSGLPTDPPVDIARSQINLSKENEVFPSYNLLLIQSLLFSFLKNHKIKLNHPLKEGIINFLSFMGPELEVDDEDITWLFIHKCLVGYLKSISKISMKFQKALELFFKSATIDGRPIPRNDTEIFGPIL